MKKYSDVKDLLEVFEKFSDGSRLEPFDPEYLRDTPSGVPRLSSSEERLLTKLAILERALKKAHVRFDWSKSMECFRVCKYVGDSSYPTYRYVGVNMDEDDYFFGTEDEDLVFDKKSLVVVNAVVSWESSRLVRKPKQYLVQPLRQHKGFCPTVCNSMEEAKEQLSYWRSQTRFRWVIIEK